MPPYNDNQMVVAYYRYSSSSQNEASIEQQREMVHKWAKSQSLVVVNEYEDAAKTGTKADRPGEPGAVRSDGLAQTGANTVISLSAKTGAGLDLLKHALLQEVGWQGESESLFLARSRHLNALHEAEAELENAALCDNNQIELFAEHLRLAQNACSEITGEFTADDLLGVIFSRFCIGK